MIAAEGKHITESHYLDCFNGYEFPYNIHFSSGNETDPLSLISNLKRDWENKGFSYDDGDLAFIVLDLDNDSIKAEKLGKLINDNKDIGFIISNPSIEVWFLFHFQKNPKRYSNQTDLIKELCNFIKDYEKNGYYNKTLFPKTKEAIINSREKAHQQDKIYYWPSIDCNPRTDMHEIVSIISNK